MGIRKMLIVLDCDRTIWNHHDATILKPPFTRISTEEIVDSRGERIRLNNGILRFLRYLKVKGHKIAIASWNEPSNVLRLIDMFNLRDYFDMIVVEPHPDKALMLRKILNELNMKSSNVVFIDDNPEMHRRVKKEFPDVLNMIYGEDIRDFNDALRKLVRLLGKPLRAYVALPIVHAESLEFNKRYVSMVERCGVDVVSKWVAGEIGEEKVYTPSDVFKRDISALEKSDILIADVSKPSHGVGMEIMYAYMRGKKIIATYKRESRISSMIRGMPNITLIAYDALDELEEKLWKNIYKAFSR